MDSTNFKSSMFGGFRRKDVINYIEKNALETNQLIHSLEKDADGLTEENRTLRDQLASVSGERDRYAASVSEALAEQDRLRAELDALRAELTAVTTQRDAFRREADTLRPRAEEFAAVKANLAELELAARSRAETYEADSRAKSDAYAADTRAAADAYADEAHAAAEAYADETRAAADAYANDTHAAADAYADDTHAAADAYADETRAAADAYGRTSHEKVENLIDGVRGQCDGILATLAETCANVSARLDESRACVSRLPAAFHTLRHDLEGLGDTDD